MVVNAEICVSVNAANCVAVQLLMPLLVIPCTWVVVKVSVTYVMFLSDGKPVRAKVDLELQESEPIKGQLVKAAKESPDHAKVYTVQRGDTLQSISFREYDDPAEWRRIADANAVDDPMALEPGTKLLVPPILK